MLVAVGVLIRLLVFAQNRSLWLDEAMLANNLVERSPAALLLPLADDQAAPIGFLMVEKGIISVLGGSERALRLFPLLSGIAVQILLMLLVLRVTKPPVGIWVLFFTATCGPLVYYSSEVKQYSSDSAIAALILLLADWLTRRGALLSIPRAVAMGLVGAGAVWLAYPAVFVMAAAGIILVYVNCRSKRRLFLVGAVIATWLSSFFILYCISLRHLVGHTGLQGYWSDAFPPRSLGALMWAYRSMLGVFRSPGGFTASALAAFCCILGAIRVARDGRLFALLVSPIIFTLIAAFFRKYPFAGRVVLFLVPIFMIFIAEGLNWLVELAKERARLVASLLTLLLGLYPLRLSMALISSNAPPTEVLAEVSIPPREQLRDVVSYIQIHRQSGDALSIYPLALPAFKFYTSTNPIVRSLPSSELQIPTSLGSANALTREFRRNRRTWVVFSHSIKTGDLNDEALTLLFLDGSLRRIDTYRVDGGSAYLYESLPQLTHELY